MKLSTLLTLSVLALSTAAFAQAPARGTAGRAGAKPEARGQLAGAARGQRAATTRAQRAPEARGRAAAAKNLPPEQRLDARQQNQDRRIQAGTAQGQLTPDEINKLQSLESNIQTMETNFKSDGTLSKDETQQLRQALNAASLQIWAERHDTQGNQKPAHRLGKDVFATDDLTNKLESPDLTKPQARQFLQDFRQLVTLKRRLAATTDSPEERATLQARYTTLLNQYFTVK